VTGPPAGASLHHDRVRPPTATAQPSSLPAQPTPLLGRAQDLAGAVRQVRRPDVRLLTFTGSGGIGKSRLALAVAAALLDEFAHGAYFVDLAPLCDPALVIPAIAQALGNREAGDQRPLESVQRWLRDKQALLVLDNCEHVLAAAPGVAELLAACPGLKVLATSRAPLHLRWEHELPVSPLALPDLEHLPGPELLAGTPAVALFVARAQAVKPDFALGRDNAAAVAELCHRLDGLPLAIELAAVRVKVLSPPALLARLRRRLTLLTGGARDLPTRQRTLRDAIAWSYDLLNPGEQSLFARLAVFVDGCTLEAVGAVCAAGGEGHTDVLEGLTSLVDKNLLRPDEAADDEPRFRMLETIREYAAERLEAGGEAAALRRGHAAHYLALAEAAEPELFGPGQVTWRERLAREHDNLRAALAWFIERGDAERALRLGKALGWFWTVRGHLTEGRERLAAALALAGPASASGPARRAALRHAARLAERQGDYAASRALAEESLAHSRAAGDLRGTLEALHQLGIVAAAQGAYPAAQALLEEALPLAQASVNRRYVGFVSVYLGKVAYEQGHFGAARGLFEEALARFEELGDRQRIARALNYLGQVAYHQRDYAAAQGLLDRSLLIWREVGYRQGIATALAALGYLAADQGDHATARARFAESLVVLREVGHRQQFAFLLGGIAALAVVEDGDPARRMTGAARALRLAGAAGAIREAIGAPLPPIWQARLERALGQARRTLGDAAASEAWAEGRAMSLEAVIDCAMATIGPLADAAAQGTSAESRHPIPFVPRRRDPLARLGEGAPEAHPATVEEPHSASSAAQIAPRRRLPGGLTARETEVLRLLASGQTNREIAEALVVSAHTVERHVANLYRKIDARGRADATAYALRHGLLPASLA
jgi:predicted ATPase/DNA-binding CsgD family transcriptional regulator